MAGHDPDRPSVDRFPARETDDASHRGPAEQATPEQLADYIRGHWGIENRLHRVRDVTFDEDRSQIRAGNAAHVMASVRNLTISIHRLAGAVNIAKALHHAMRNPNIAREFTQL